MILCGLNFPFSRCKKLKFTTYVSSTHIKSRIWFEIKIPRNNDVNIGNLWSRLEQALHKQQEKHSWHAGNIFFKKGALKYLKMPFYVLESFPINFAMPSSAWQTGDATKFGRKGGVPCRLKYLSYENSSAISSGKSFKKINICDSKDVLWQRKSYENRQMISGSVHKPLLTHESSCCTSNTAKTCLYWTHENSCYVFTSLAAWNLE